MPEVEESVSFTTHLTTWPTYAITRNALTVGIFKYDFYTLHPYYIYSHYLQNCKESIQKKTIKRFLQHTHLVRESYSSSRKQSLQSLLLSSPIVIPLRGDLYPNKTHTYSECRECFGAWKVLGICQNKPVRIGDAIGQYYRIWEARKDKTPRSPLVVGAWRFQVI